MTDRTGTLSCMTGASDNRRRLQDAALELYASQGYAATTVAEVAAHAGLTERTYFRHFPDKREVLFANDAALRDRLVEAVDAAPATLNTRDAILLGLDAMARELQPRREALRRRAPLIASHPDLQERDLVKYAARTSALRGALVRRGLDPPAAVLAAEIFTAAFHVAATRWVREEAVDDDLITVVHATFDDVTALLR